MNWLRRYIPCLFTCHFIVLETLNCFPVMSDETLTSSIINSCQLNFDEELRFMTPTYRTVLGPPHTESTQHDATRSPPPLYPMWSKIRLSRIGVSMLPRTLSRCVSRDTNRIERCCHKMLHAAFLSQNVACCISHLYTLLREGESAVPKECCNGYKYSVLVI